MGRSPGKWIKTVLFGKKSSKSHASKGKDASKSVSEYIAGKGQSSPAVTSPVISQPVLISTNRNGVATESEKGATSSLGTGAVTKPINQEMENQKVIETDVSKDSEKVKEEQAAVKMQAFLRGFLSRRAFHALKGIIRLQALLRGHLVRRQAVATLYSLQGIVVLQALVRGQGVRRSGICQEVATKYRRGKDVDGKQSDSRKESMLANPNAYIRKLVSALPVAMPLQIQYVQGEPNSVLSWQERWTLSQFWKPIPQPKKAIGTSSQARRSNRALDSESGRPKQSVYRNPTASIDCAPANNVTESERPKRNPRKLPSTPADLMQEHPQTELEKVKRSLRKVSNSTSETFERPEVENENPACSLKKASSLLTDVPRQDTRGSIEKMKKDVEVTTESKTVTESASILDASDEPNNAVIEVHPTCDLHQSQNTEKEDNISLMNEELSLKEEQSCNESQKSSKRRASFSSKSEYHTENGLQNAPKLPSYMAATESAKAKLRGQVSPRFGSDSAGKNSITRRHSLPSSVNGKLSSQSPRTQKLIQSAGKGGIRNDRSLSSSRDGNEKAIQVEWRR